MFQIYIYSYADNYMMFIYAIYLLYATIKKIIFFSFFDFYFDFSFGRWWLFFYQNKKSWQLLFKIATQ